MTADMGSSAVPTYGKALLRLPPAPSDDGRKIATRLNQVSTKGPFLRRNMHARFAEALRNKPGVQFHKLAYRIVCSWIRNDAGTQSRPPFHVRARRSAARRARLCGPEGRPSRHHPRPMGGAGEAAQGRGIAAGKAGEIA